MGDARLQGVAARLQELVRESDTVAWLGGDEFILISAGIGRVEDTVTIAGRVLAAFSPPFTCRGRLVQVSASVGVAHNLDIHKIIAMPCSLVALMIINVKISLISGH